MVHLAGNRYQLFALSCAPLRMGFKDIVATRYGERRLPDRLFKGPLWDYRDRRKGSVDVFYSKFRSGFRIAQALEHSNGHLSSRLRWRLSGGANQCGKKKAYHSGVLTADFPKSFNPAGRVRPRLGDCPNGSDGTFAPLRMREQAASDNPVALPISLSENASSFGAISRLNHASSRWPGCSRAQLRLRRCPSLIASPRARFTVALRRGSLPAAVCVGALCEPLRSLAVLARVELWACTHRNDGACA